MYGRLAKHDRKPGMRGMVPCSANAAFSLMYHTRYRLASVPPTPMDSPRIWNDVDWSNTAANIALPPATNRTPATPSAAWYAYSCVRSSSSCVISVPRLSYASSVVSRQIWATSDNDDSNTSVGEGTNVHSNTQRGSSASRASRQARA